MSCIYIMSDLLWYKTRGYAVRAEGLHFSTFHYYFMCTCTSLWYYSCLLPSDATLDSRAILDAVSTVNLKHFWDRALLGLLGVPKSVRSQIRDSQSYSSEDERRIAGLDYYLKIVPGASWGKIAGVLWFLAENRALEKVRQHLPQKIGE